METITIQSTIQELHQKRLVCMQKFFRKPFLLLRIFHQQLTQLLLLYDHTNLENTT
jgi:hypothetical protein